MQKMDHHSMPLEPKHKAKSKHKQVDIVKEKEEEKDKWWDLMINSDKARIEMIFNDIVLLFRKNKFQELLNFIFC